jgi:hypothetical protein
MSSKEPKPKRVLRLLTASEREQRQAEWWWERLNRPDREPSFVGWDKWDERMALLDAESEPKGSPFDTSEPRAG